MGRPLRLHLPGDIHLVTIRCHQARFFMRPDSELNDVVLEWLTRAQERFPEQRILAVCVMSNHLHLVIRDDNGALAAWASYFFGNLARGVNRIRDRSGAFYERRYAEEPILDDEALVDRLVYVVANPVKAGLSPTAKEWPGVVLIADRGRPRQIEVRLPDRDAYRAARAQARRRSESPPSRSDFFRLATLVVDPASVSEGKSAAAALRSAISSREQEIGRYRRQQGLGFLTRSQILAQSWEHAPERPARRPRPLCHASDSKIRDAYRESFDKFVALFRQACERLRRAGLGVSFPEGCYPPGGRFARPQAAPA